MSVQKDNSSYCMVCESVQKDNSSYCMVCVSVQKDNPSNCMVCASVWEDPEDYLPVQTQNLTINCLLHQQAFVLCPLQDI